MPVLVLASPRRVTSDPLTSRPTFLVVQGVDRHRGHSAVSSDNAITIAEEFLAANGSVFGIANVADELKVERAQPKGTGVRMVKYLAKAGDEQ